MQREILFRAKRTDTGEWVYGFYFEENHLGIIKAGITRYERLEGKDVCYEVEPITAGQFIGIYDKDGKKIFEGDIDSRGNVVTFHPNLTWDSGGSPHSGFYLIPSYCEIGDEVDLDYGLGFNEDTIIVGTVHDKED